ncbi:MAG: hypothetical protein NUV83_02100 [Candidatus Wolfebacteria bacterium]|nr:hypothetical protein [Candidatus Wolfebacteria bacterium]
MKTFTKNSQKGMTFLPMIILISAIILEIGATVVLLANFSTENGYGFKNSQEAFALGRSGIFDAILQLERNKNYTTNGIVYSLNIDIGKSFEVVVCNNSKINIASSTCDFAAPGYQNKADIISTGKVVNKNRRLEAIININSATTEIKIESLKEISI